MALLVKVLIDGPDDLSLISRTLMTEEENQLLRVVPWCPM